MSSAPHNADVLVSELADEEDMIDIVEMFVDELPDRVSEIERLVSEENLEELARRAHQLKGSAGGYGFPAITVAAKVLESGAKAAEGIESLRRQVDDLADLCRRARAKPT